MNSKIILVLFGLLALVSAVPSNIQTVQRFKSSFKQDLVVYMGQPQNPFEIKQETILNAMKYADVTGQASELFKRQGPATEIKVEVYGSQKVDALNNILLQHADKFVMGDINLKIDATSLLMYDLNKNYTWDAKECTCDVIRDISEMPFFFVPPFSSLVSENQKIKIEGKDVNVNIYDASITLSVNPGTGQMSKRVEQGSKEVSVSVGFRFYADPETKFLRRLTFNYTIDLQFFVFSISSTIDMWDIKLLSGNEVILPADSCKDKCNATVQIIDTYPPCTTTIDKCTCPPKFDFCTGVNYRISESIYPTSTDSFVKTTYEETLAEMKKFGSVSDSCQDGLKEFLCKFYFPYCANSSAYYLKPELSVFTCGNSKRADSDTQIKQRNAAMNTGAFSAYAAAEGRTSDHTDVDDDKEGGLSKGAIAGIIIGCVAGVALVAGLAFFLVKRRRASYQSIH